MITPSHLLPYRPLPLPTCSRGRAAVFQSMQAFGSRSFVSTKPPTG